MAQTLTVVGVTATSATLQLGEMPGSDFYQVVWRPSSTTELEGIESTYDTVYTISGLQPGTEYVANYSGWTNDGPIAPWMPSGVSFTTLSQGGRPTDWQWWTTVEAGQPITFTADEWLAFMGRIDEFRVYKGQEPWPWTDAYTPSSGSLIAADVVNAARWAIDGLYPPVSTPALVKAGDPITAYTFQQLRDSLNSL